MKPEDTLRWAVVTAILLIPVYLTTLPITIYGLHLNQNPLHKLVDALLGPLDPACPGAFSWDDVNYDEVWNLGLPVDRHKGLLDADQEVIGQAIQNKLAQLPSDDITPREQHMCYRAINEAADSLCYNMDKDSTRRCKLRLMHRLERFHDHFEHSACQTARHEKAVQKELDRATDQACNEREAALWQEGGYEAMEQNLCAILDPRFVWKKRVYDFFSEQIREEGFEQPTSCFTDDDSWPYVRSIELPSPKAGPSRMQYWLVYGTVVYCLCVPWLAGCLARRRYKPRVSRVRVPSPLPVEGGEVLPGTDTAMATARSASREGSRRAGRVKPI